MSADSPRRSSRGVPAIVPPQVVSDRSIIDSVAGFINDVTLTNQPQVDPKDTIIWARFEMIADISDPTYGDDWELEGNMAPPLLLILGYGLGVQVWAIPANGEATEVLSWRHGHVTALRILPTPISSDVEMADEPIDQFADKRPLMALCEGSPPGCNSQYSSVNFVSLKEGTQVKTIKFKNNALDVLANRTSIVITFPERIAVFDARTFEDRLSVTTCYPSPGVNPNPVALGPRWMAYSENRLIHSKRSGGGCDGDGVSSYTATVLNAAKSLGKGLRELGEQVAAGLTGTSGGSGSKQGSFDSGTGDIKQPGVITILDIKHQIKDVSPTTGSPISVIGTDPIVAHFIAHLEAIVALEFDNSGMLLLTADKRGHDFHVFRIQPHPVGSQLAAIHHLYVLHRGDTSAKVQNIAFSLDSRWVAVSTLRGTTHVFPINSYGGPAGVRTHSSLHVVNRLSRFHRSAGLSADGRSSSPISHSDSTTFNQVCMPYNNPTIPPFPRPHVVLPLAQLRQPSALGSPPGSAQNSYAKPHARQRLSSLSDDNGKPLSVCAVFAKARSWLLDPPNLARDTPAHKIQRKAVDSLFIMAGHGALIQYDLDTKLASNIAKEKICDDTPIELDVEAKAQWNLGRKDGSIDIQPPLPSDNLLVKNRRQISCTDSTSSSDDEDRWLSQVEIITHAGPHRRLWMGPQCVFKTYNTPSGAPLSHIDTEAVEIGINSGATRPGRSSPMNMPLPSASRSTVPVLIESGSYSSIEQSPKLMDRFRHDHMDSDYALSHGESRLKEDLADAMRESPSVPHRESGYLTPPCSAKNQSITLLHKPTAKFTTTSTTTETYQNDKVHYYEVIIDDEIASRPLPQSTSTSPTVSISLPSSSSSDRQQQQSSPRSIEKVVNPLGTVTTITHSSSDNELDMNPAAYTDYVIHENCDESLFRPVVAIFCGEDDRKSGDLSKSEAAAEELYKKPPESIGTELVVPVIEKAVKNNKKKNNSNNKKNNMQAFVSVGISSPSSGYPTSTVTIIDEKSKSEEKDVVAKFDEFSLLNKKCKTSNISGSKKQQSNRNEKEKTPPIESVITSCENENYSGKQKTQKSENTRKKSREEIKSRIEETYQQQKLKIVSQEKSKTPDNLKKVNDQLSQSFKKESSPGIENETIKSKAKRNLVEPEILSKNNYQSSNRVSVEDNIFKKAKTDDYSLKKEEQSIKIMPKVASDPKLSKFKSTDYSLANDIKSASSEKSLKTKKSKGNSNSKQKSVIDTIVTKQVNTESENDQPPIKFYEKFNKDSPKEDSPPKEMEIQNFNAKEDISSITISTPSPAIVVAAEKTSTIEAKKSNKKSKQTTPSVSPRENSPRHSPKMTSNKSQKDIESILVDAKLETVEVTNIETMATIALPVIKKSKQQSKENKQKDISDEVDNFVTLKASKEKDAEKFKLKEFPSLSFDTTLTPEQLSEAFLPPLSPLEPFESKFETLFIKDASTDDHVSLINFESPLQEIQNTKSSSVVRNDVEIEIDESITSENQSANTSAIEAFNKKLSEENIIFALCGSLHYDEGDKNSESISQPSTFSIIECESDDKDCSKASQYKSFERLNDNDEQYSSLEHQENTSASSSEETEESACLATNGDKKLLNRKLADDDEELRPLIGGANSACSMTSSMGGGCKKIEDDNTSIALEIANAIIETLPDNNQSDSSDQANLSEPGETDVEQNSPSSLSDTATTEPIAVVAEKQSGNENASKQQPQQDQQQHQQPASNSGCCGSSIAQSNGKKKSKRKKR